MEQAKEDQRPEEGKPPDVADRVQTPFRVLGGQVERREWRRRVVRRSAVPPNQSATLVSGIILFRRDGRYDVRRISHCHGAQRALRLSVRSRRLRIDELWSCGSVEGPRELSLLYAYTA